MTQNAYDVLQERGFVKQCTDPEAVRALLGAGQVTTYIGYDPTASSLHVGNLFTLMALMHLERLGHRPLVVLGGGTAMVGDPSGKTEMRKMLDEEAIGSNIESFRAQISRFLDIDGGKTLVVNNADWLRELRYVDFLREIGRHFSVNRMLSAEAYKLRMERGLSFIEFNYQILQAYDFFELRRRFDCRLQMGGDDQWGNILAGVDLCRRIDSELVQGMTFPLLLTATGEKMGKTASGAVWLDAERLSPYDFYQYWVNVHDDDVESLLGYYTFLPMDEVRAVAELKDAELNMAKSILAFEVTTVVHGADEANKAHSASQGAFGSRVIPNEILPSSTVARAVTADVDQIPTMSVEPGVVSDGLALIDVMVETGLAGSKKAARRLVDQGAVQINVEKIADSAYLLSASDFKDSALTVRAGKKKVHRVVLSQ